MFFIGIPDSCKNYRGISLLSTVGKLYAKKLIERVTNVNQEKIWEAQAGFRREMGCVDQIFPLRSLSEKYIANKKKIYCAFIDLEKAHDRVVRNELWSVLLKYGVSSQLVQALKSVYENSKACVRINGAYTDWFGILRGVRQGCVASSWLFNLFMDSCLTSLKGYESGIRQGDLLAKCLLYADDQVLFASSAEELQDMITLMNEEFLKNGMKINAGKRR